MLLVAAAVSAVSSGTRLLSAVCWLLAELEFELVLVLLVAGEMEMR
jgi:hypothetical protein